MRHVPVIGIVISLVVSVASCGADGTEGGSGKADGSTSAAGATGQTDTGTAAAPTFTMLYTQIFSKPAGATSTCAAAACHNPGAEQGISFVDKATAYRTLVPTFVTAKNASGSKLFTEIDTGKMPKGGTKLSAPLIEMVRAWIVAGAKND